MAESYTGRDMIAIRQELIDLIPSLTDKWTDFSESDPGMALIELMAHVSDLNNFYIDKMSLEHYLETAIEEKNIRKILLQVDRKPYMASASSVMMRATIKEKMDLPVRIPMGTSFTSSSKRTFSVLKDVYIPAGELSVDFIAYEGKFHFLKFKANALKKEIKTTVSSPATQGISFSIDGDYWDQVNNTFYHSSEKVFEAAEDHNGKLVIKLSESFKDFISPNASTAMVTVLSTTFNSGSITTGAINVDVTIPLNDSTFKVNFKNILPSVGGSPRESIADIKKRIPKVVRIADRPVTLQDYRDIFNTIPDIAKASVLDWNVPGGYVLEPYVVKAYVVPKSFSRLNPTDSLDLSTLITSIGENYIPNISVGVDLRVVPPEYLPYIVSLKVKTTIPYMEQQLLINNLNNFITDYFSYENVNFGDTINTSVLISEILGKFKEVTSVTPTNTCTLYENSSLSQFIYLAYLNIEIDRS